MERGADAIFTSAIFSFLSLFFVVIRCISRFWILQHHGIDDFMIIGALLLSIGVTLTIGFQFKYGLGKHRDDLHDKDVEHVLQLLYASIILYNLALYVVKISICVQYLRIFIKRRFRFATWFMIGFVVLGGLTLLFVQAFTCIPVAKYWDNSIEGHCFPSTPVWFTASTFAIVTDFSVWALPIPVVWDLHLPKKQKWGLLLVFVVGFFGCIVGILRLKSIYDASSSPDITYHNVSSSSWSSIELNIGIICACVPTIRPILRTWFPTLMQSTRQTTTNPTVAPSRYHQFNDSTVELSNAVGFKHGIATSAHAGPGDDEGSLEGLADPSSIQVKQEFLVTNTAKD